MSPDDRLRVVDYLGHMLQAIERIDRYLDGVTLDALIANEEKQDAVVRNLEILGEAAGAIRRNYPDFVVAHPEVPWAGIYGMRNVLIHGYFKVDIHVVWQATQRDLSRLEAQIRPLRQTLIQTAE